VCKIAAMAIFPAENLGTLGMVYEFMALPSGYVKIAIEAMAH